MISYIRGELVSFEKEKIIVDELDTASLCLRQVWGCFHNVEMK